MCWPFHPWRNYPALAPRQRVAFLIDDMERIDSDPEAEPFYFGDKSRLDAFYALKKSRWGSGYFGIPMGEISHVVSGSQNDPGSVSAYLDYVLAAARKQCMRHLSVRVDSEDVLTRRVLRDYGFDIVTVELIHVMDEHIFCDREDACPDLSVREFSPDDTAAVLDIGQKIDEGLKSRFWLDGTLPRERSAQYYRECMRNACSRKNADRIFVALWHNEIVGVYALRHTEGNASFGCPSVYHSVLVGIDPSCRQKGIATAFLKRVFGQLFLQRCFITGRVYGHNMGMVLLMEKMKARLVSMQYCMHMMLGGEAT